MRAVLVFICIFLFISSLDEWVVSFRLGNLVRRRQNPSSIIVSQPIELPELSFCSTIRPLSLLMKESSAIDFCKAKNPHVRVVLPDRNAASYFLTKPNHQPVPWKEVFDKISEKLVYEKNNLKYDAKDEDITLETIYLSELEHADSNLPASPITLLVGLTASSAREMEIIQYLAGQSAVVSVFNSSSSVNKLEKFGKFSPHASSWKNRILNVRDRFFKTKRALNRGTYQIVQDMWMRRSVEDLLFMVFVLLDSFGVYDIKSVRSVTSSSKTGWKELKCMCKNCAKEIAACMADETCRKALECLDKCKGNDQVCSYRCITSHETPAFEAFAKCILQKNNCMGNKATIPVYPDPAPLSTFRNRPLDFETAENIFIGHLHIPSGYPANHLISDNAKGLPWSWKVVCGQNPAYDYFACQHQIFYRNLQSRNASLLWYDPVFKVTTIYGEEVWRRRHYKVRRGKQPGQFYFAVSDNGVVSSEFWRILDCADDLSWAVFFYTGAASVAGTSYTGSLVVTPDGRWPRMDGDTQHRINAALAKGQIANWELFEVNNECCSSEDPAKKPPLGIPHATNPAS